MRCKHSVLTTLIPIKKDQLLFKQIPKTISNAYSYVALLAEDDYEPAICRAPLSLVEGVLLGQVLVVQQLGLDHGHRCRVRDAGHHQLFEDTGRPHLTVACGRDLLLISIRVRRRHRLGRGGNLRLDCRRHILVQLDAVQELPGSDDPLVL